MIKFSNLGAGRDLKPILGILNNLYELEIKLQKIPDATSAMRNLERIKDLMREIGAFYEDPLGQQFKETRTDLEVSISGTDTHDLIVVQVIKPIIRFGGDTFSQIAQKGIVVVESKKDAE